MSADQFTRWLCPRCGEDGIDSWNKAMFDGRDGSIPNPLIIGGECWRCWWPMAVSYTTPDAPPRAILGSSVADYSHEDETFKLMQRDPDAGIPLKPGITRDVDWSLGCIVARGRRVDLL